MASWRNRDAEALGGSRLAAVTRRQLQSQPCHHRGLTNRLLGIPGFLGHVTVAVTADDRPMPQAEHHDKHLMNVAFTVHEMDDAGALLGRQRVQRRRRRLQAMEPFDALFVSDGTPLRPRPLEFGASPVVLVQQAQGNTVTLQGQRTMAVKPARRGDVADVAQTGGLLERCVVERGGVMGHIDHRLAAHGLRRGLSPTGQKVAVVHALVVEEAIGGLGLVAIGQCLRKSVERFFGQMGEQALKPRVEASVRQGRGRGHLSGPERCGKRC
jgi:hypothetical protein